MQWQLSDVGNFFSGKPFDDWRKGRENDGKRFAAEIDRLDGIIKAVGALSKAMQARR